MGGITVPTAEGLVQFARRLRLPPTALLALSGPLGAGKTTFVKGLVPAHLEREVQSPTFTLLNPYPTTPPLFHFDLYRLTGEADFLALGLDEFFTQGICVIEWPERIAPLLPPNTLRITFTLTPDGSRHLELSGNWQGVLD